MFRVVEHPVLYFKQTDDVRDVWNKCFNRPDWHRHLNLFCLLNSKFWHWTLLYIIVPQLFITKELQHRRLYLPHRKLVCGDNIWTVWCHYTKFPGVGQSCLLNLVTKFDVKDLRGFRGNRCVSIVQCFNRPGSPLLILLAWPDVRSFVQ